jgi:hypothetical protein
VSSELEGYLRFPHARQVFRIESTVRLSGVLKRELHYGVTSLAAHEVGPRQLLELSRGHWSIENKLHWVRDVVFDEDRCRIRARNGAQVMATLRNLVISVLRLARAKSIAAALRHCAWRPELALRLLGA